MTHILIPFILSLQNAEASSHGIVRGTPGCILSGRMETPGLETVGWVSFSFQV